jgi:molybdenum cofactor cytidylyltransferase
MLAAVILAGGESRRMGRPKALLPFPADHATPGKITFLEHLISVAQHPRIGFLRVVLGAHAEQIQKRVNLPADSVVLNPEWPRGQLSSIRAALRSLPPGKTDGMILFLVDHPLISAGLVSTLIDTFYATGAPIVIPTYNGRRGHPVIFSSHLYDALIAAPDDVGARAVVWANAADVREVPTTEAGVVLNLNDPRALKELQR